MKRLLASLPLFMIPLLLCGSYWSRPQEQTEMPTLSAVYIPDVLEGIANEQIKEEVITVPDCKPVDFIPKPQPEQESRYPGVDFSSLTDAEREIVTFLLDRDVSLEAACGILANINRETGGSFDPCVTNDIGATGLCQWLGGRLCNLWQRSDCYTVKGQLDFLLHELETTETGTDLTGSAYDCGYRFARDFERTGIAATYTDRGVLAQEYYERLTEYEN